MKIVHPDKWLPCDGISLEEAADTAVRCSDRHVLVVAGPGAGKTELLAQKAAFLFQTNQCREPQKILAISFKTDAAQNLKERVEKRCGTDIKGRFVSMTYDAFAKNILDHFLYALPDELRPATDYLVNDPDIIDAAFHCAGFKNPNGFTQSRLKTEYDDILSRISLPLTGDGLGHKVWPLLLKGFNGNKATLTFKMIMMLAMYIIETNPYIKQALQMTYSFVFLDEFQDTTAIQYAFVKENIQQKLDTEQWHSTLNSIIDFFGIGNIKAKFPAYKQGTYFMNVINQFESLFFEEYVAAHGVWNLAIENFRGDHSVPIMTIHKSKGLEYNAVYFIGLEDSAFWNFRNQPDEDRCTFFVALSRAKASVTFTFCKKRSGMKCPMQRHNAINEFFDLLQRPGIAEVKRFQNR